MERKTKMKIGYFIKENKMKTSTLNQHGIPEQNRAEKLQNTSNTELNMK
jgi:hypothetical protein